MAFTNIETLFLEVSVTIRHLSTRERVRKKKKNGSTIFKKTKELVRTGLSRQCFLQKQ